MNIQSDSKKIKQGNTFIALEGYEYDGHDFIEEAIANGATEVIANKGLYSVETLIVNDTKKYLIDYLDKTYREELKNLKIIGVTGTNGKTTTCYLIQQALNKLDTKCAYIGTLGFYMGDKIRDLNNTTPGIIDIYEMLIECKEKGYNYVVMEVSSHALDMDRIGNLKFDYAIFTNLTRDHLDYHKTIENYAKAKQKLFDKIKENGKSIINCDDEYKDYFAKEGSILYGFTGGNYTINDFKISNEGTYFAIKKGENVIEFDSKLLGKHNIYNMLVTIIVLDNMGYGFDKIKDIIKNIKSPDGRMDTINNDEKTYIIDYAHTPDAVEKIINTVKEFNKGKIITIIGCGGNRDKTKRPLMSNISTKLSNYVIFTSDNPRYENPEEIIDDMICNLSNDNYEVIINRHEAIKKGIQMMDKNDILLLLGKGHETYQIVNGTKTHFDDKEEVLKLIRR